MTMTRRLQDSSTCQGWPFHGGGCIRNVRCVLQIKYPLAARVRRNSDEDNSTVTAPRCSGTSDRLPSRITGVLCEIIHLNHLFVG